MLVLSRKKSQEIVIDFAGRQVSVVVVEIRGDTARLGVAAPDDVAVHRREVYDAILREHGVVANLTRARKNTEEGAA